MKTQDISVTTTKIDTTACKDELAVRQATNDEVDPKMLYS